MEYKHVRQSNSKQQNNQERSLTFHYDRSLTENKLGETRIAEPTKNC